eukprot:TRINITY_DN14537_c0_g1_i2.p1 TRINITY_DN14537_c0_g1~~TRINITY_DN14537_c0_g1_i2.p1  ORF type:complete len:189 (+),score=56.72 TRINITY_DN14537_c0_g1_i2:76-642(+)
MFIYLFFFFFQAEDGIRDAQESRGLGDVYKRQGINAEYGDRSQSMVGGGVMAWYRPWYPRVVGTVFLAIAVQMVACPAMMLGQDGVQFNEMNVAARAEVRAYYVGTALCIAAGLLALPANQALRGVGMVLGCFAGSRVLSYASDGIDSDEGFRLHQHCVFAAEVLGTVVAVLLIGMEEPAACKESKVV